MQTVHLTYFKATGKYYSEGEVKTDRPGNDDLVPAIHEIWDEIQDMQMKGQLPGLSSGSGKDFYILVQCPGHEHDHPRLIMPLRS